MLMAVPMRPKMVPTIMVQLSGWMFCHFCFMINSPLRFYLFIIHETDGGE